MRRLRTGAGMDAWVELTWMSMALSIWLIHVYATEVLLLCRCRTERLK
jgi:hypothetical protein